MAVDYDNGLSTEQARKHRVSYGANAITESKPASIATLLLEGVKEPMMVLLLSIAALSLIFGETVEAAVMIFVVAAYVSVEFVNKLRTDRTMARLRELTQPTTKVIREGRMQEIPTTEAVVGDLIIVSAGVRIPADAKLIESSGRARRPYWPFCFELPRFFRCGERGYFYRGLFLAKAAQA